MPFGVCTWSAADSLCFGLCLQVTSVPPSGELQVHRPPGGYLPDELLPSPAAPSPRDTPTFAFCGVLPLWSPLGDTQNLRAMTRFGGGGGFQERQSLNFPPSRNDRKSRGRHEVELKRISGCFLHGYVCSCVTHGRSPPHVGQNFLLIAVNCLDFLGIVVEKSVAIILLEAEGTIYFLVHL